MPLSLKCWQSSKSCSNSQTIHFLKCTCFVASLRLPVNVLESRVILSDLTEGTGLLKLPISRFGLLDSDVVSDLTDVLLTLIGFFSIPPPLAYIGSLITEVSKSTNFTKSSKLASLPCCLRVVSTIFAHLSCCEIGNFTCNCLIDIGEFKTSSSSCLCNVKHFRENW